MTHFTRVTCRHLNNNNITHIRGGILQQVPRLINLNLRGNPLVNVDWDAFAFLPRLQKLYAVSLIQQSAEAKVARTDSLALILMMQDFIRSEGIAPVPFTQRIGGAGIDPH